MPEEVRFCVETHALEGPVQLLWVHFSGGSEFRKVTRAFRLAIHVTAKLCYAGNSNILGFGILLGELDRVVRLLRRCRKQSRL